VDGSSPPGRCDAGDGKPQGHQQPAGSSADDYRPQYVVGFTWARQYGFRIVEGLRREVCAGAFGGRTAGDAGGRGFSTLTSTNAVGAVTTSTNFFINAPERPEGLFNAFDATGYTVNKSPDVIVKAAADPGFDTTSCLESSARFRNRIFPCSVVGTTAKDNPLPTPQPLPVTCPVDGSTAPSALGAFDDTRVGGGLGVSGRWPLFNKKLDFGGERRGGRWHRPVWFGNDAGRDVPARWHGGVDPHGARIGHSGIHPSPKLMFTCTAGRNTRFALLTPGTRQSRSLLRRLSQPLHPISGGHEDDDFDDGHRRIRIAVRQQQRMQHGTASDGNVYTVGGRNVRGDIRLITEGTIGFWHKFYNGRRADCAGASSIRTSRRADGPGTWPTGWHSRCFTQSG